MRRSPLARVSKKRRLEQRSYDDARTAAWLRDKGQCQAENVWPEIECGGRLDPHHIWPTGVYPERRCDPDAMIVLCRRHHEAAHHQDPVRARKLGLLA